MIAAQSSQPLKQVFGQVPHDDVTREFQSLAKETQEIALEIMSQFQHKYQAYQLMRTTFMRSDDLIASLRPTDNLNNVVDLVVLYFITEHAKE
jgi:hypothetical protein